MGVQKAREAVPLHPQVGSILSFAHGVMEVDVFFPGLESNSRFGVPSGALDCFTNHLFLP